MASSNGTSLDQQDNSKSVTPNGEVYKRPNRSGRSSRRRKAKLRAIQEAEEKLWNGLASEENIHVKGTPNDRDRAWPGVLERRCGEWVKADEVSLMGQLGYIPGNAVAVAARSSQVAELGIEGDVPIVLQLYPIAVRDTYAGGRSDGRKFKSRKRGPTKQINSNQDDEEEQQLIEPFPTMYWLTHPLLRTLTSKLEIGKNHNVKVLESRLTADETNLDSMKLAHDAYGQARWSLLTNDDQDLMESRKWKFALTTGVAGIRKPFAVKCLHAHLAHYLSGGPGSEENLVGKWVLEELCNIVKEHASGTDATKTEEDL